MLSYGYENDGNRRYLMYKLAGGEIDKVGMGMLKYNNVEGIISINETYMDGESEVRYDISSCINLSEFTRKATRSEMLVFLESICNTLLESEYYLLSPEMIILNEEQVFVDKNTCTCRLVYLPLINETKADFSSFLLHIFLNPKFDLPVTNEIKTCLYSDSLDVSRLKNVIIQEKQGKQPNIGPQGGKQPAIVTPNNVTTTTNNNVQKNASTGMYQTDGLRRASQEMFEDEPDEPISVRGVVNKPGDPMEDEPVAERRGFFSSLFTKKDKIEKETKSIDDSKEMPPWSRPAATSKSNSNNDQNSEINTNNIHDVKVAHSSSNISGSERQTKYPRQQASQQKPAVTSKETVCSTRNARPQRQPSKAGTMILEEPRRRPKTTVLMMDDNDYSKPQPKLINKNNQIISINKNVFRLGSDINDVDHAFTSNIYVSGSHCLIFEKNGQYYIKDLNSSNGTYIDGRRIAPFTPELIMDGQEIKLANEVLIFKLH